MARPSVPGGMVPKGQPPKIGPPSKTVRTVLPPANDLKDLAEDAKKLAKLLRDTGKPTEASELEKLARRLLKHSVSVALLVGGAVLATRIVQGKLVFIWGWARTYREMRRELARLQRLSPQVDETVGKLFRLAEV